MIKQTSLIQHTIPAGADLKQSKTLLTQSSGNTHMMKNHMVYCPKCKYFVGAWDKGDYYQCCRNKNHKIEKGVMTR